MIYEVRARFFFTSADESIDFFHDCLIALPKATVIKPHQIDQQCSEADHLICHHDDVPNKPCELITHIDNCP